MSLPLTKTGADVFAPTDAAGNQRKVVNSEAQVLTTEYERLLLALAAEELDIEFPYGFIRATNSDSGDPNAITATTNFAIPTGDHSALIALNIVAENDDSPVTVEFNGSGDVLTIKTNSGNDVASGGLADGMIVAGYVSGDEFRLLSDQASAAIQAAAEAAQVAAEDARDAAEGYAEDAAIAADQWAYRSRSSVTGITVPAVVTAILLLGYSAAADGGGGLYQRVGSEPSHAAKVQDDSGAWFELAETSVNPIMFGAKGDGNGVGGGTNDSTAWQDAGDFPNAVMISAEGRTYRIDDGFTIERSDLTAEGPGKLDYTNMTDRDGIAVLGARASDISLSGDASASADSISLDDASTIEVDDYLVIEDDREIQTGSGLFVSEMVRVRDVNTGSDVVSTYAPKLHDYTTANDAVVAKLTMRANVHFKNLTLIPPPFEDGVTEAFRAFNFQYARNCTVEDCNALGWGGWGVSFDDACIDCHVRRFHYRGPFNQPSNVRGRGVGHNGAQACTVEDSRFEMCRHAVATGGRGIINRFCRTVRNYVEASIDAGLDAHRQTDSCEYSYNTIMGSVAISGNNPDGVIYQGSNPRIVGNEFLGRMRYPVFFQNQQDINEAEERKGGLIADNTCRARPQTTGLAVVKVTVDGDQELRGLRIRDTEVYWTPSTLWDAVVEFDGGTGLTRRLHLKGNSGERIASKGLYVTVGSGGTVRDVEIAGGALGVESGGDCVHFNGNGSSNSIRYATVTGVIGHGGDHGVRGTNGTNNITVVGNTLEGQATAAIDLDGADNTIGDDNNIS